MAILRRDSRVVYINERTVSMSLIEYRLLSELKRAGEQIGRDELEKRLWPGDEYFNPSRLDVLLWKLRRRMPEGSIISTPKRGWSLSKRVRVVMGDGPA